MSSNAYLATRYADGTPAWTTTPAITNNSVLAQERLTRTATSTSYTWLWIILIIVVVIIILALLIYFFSSGTSNLPPPTPSTNGLLSVTNIGVITTAQTVTPGINALLTINPTGTQTITIASTNNPIGSILGIKNTSTSGTVIIQGGSGVSISNTNIGPNGYAEFILTGANTYTRLIPN